MSKPRGKRHPAVAHCSRCGRSIHYARSIYRESEWSPGGSRDPLCLNCFRIRRPGEMVPTGDRLKARKVNRARKGRRPEAVKRASDRELRWAIGATNSAYSVITPKKWMPDPDGFHEVRALMECRHCDVALSGRCERHEEPGVQRGVVAMPPEVQRAVQDWCDATDQTPTHSIPMDILWLVEPRYVRSGTFRPAPEDWEPRSCAGCTELGCGEGWCPRECACHTRLN